MFVMKHHVNSMEESTSTQGDVWIVNSGASNHMKNHEEWFMTQKKPEQSRFMETYDDTVHTIDHIGDARQDVEERLPCIDNHQEFGVAQKNYQPRHANAIQSEQMLH